MKQRLTLVVASMVWSLTTLAQVVTLHSESFETDGEGSRYNSNSYLLCPTGDFFYRTNSNPVTPPGCSQAFANSLTNIDGDFFWASEDIRSNSCGPPCFAPGFLTTQNISVAGYNSLQVSLRLATSNNNSLRWEASDSINIKVSFDGGAFVTIGRFMGKGDAFVGARLGIDGNLDGLYNGSDPATDCDITNFTPYTFSILGTGTNMQIQLDFDQLGGSEELGIDLIEVTGVGAPCTPPAIVTDPFSHSICAFTSGTFDVVASDAIGYQWEVSTNGGGSFSPISNGGVYSNANTASLTITAPSFSMAGYQYRCVVNGACLPNAVSVPATLGIVGPQFTQQPQSASVCEGGNISFGVIVSSPGFPFYTWEYSTDGGNNYSPVPNSVPYSGVNTNTLSITGATAGMSGYLYRVKLSGSICINASPPSGSATLTVTPYTAPDVPTVLDINGFTCPGNPFNMIISAGNLNSATDWKWYTGSCGGTLVAIGAFVTIPYSANTTFYVRGEGGCGTPGACASITPSEGIAPSIDTDPSSHSICAYNFGTFDVTASNATSYQWELSTDGGNSFNPIFDGGVYSNTNTASLTITNPPFSMAGYQYRCVVYGDCSPDAVSAPATLGIVGPQFTQNPQNASVCENDNTSFGVLVSSPGFPFYTWEYSTDGGSNYNPVPNAAPYSGVNTNTLSITGATLSMSGYLYRVKLSGGLCISLSPPSVSATLTVNASTTYYEDADGDGYYFNMQNSCTNPGGNWSTNPGSGGGDCNDGNADIHPGAAEICGNLIDENCNGMADDADVLFPVISGCPGTVTVNAALNASSAIASWTAPTASDDCTLASFTWTHNPGDNFPLGVTTVSYTASDLAGHITTCSFNVVVCASVTFNYSNLQVSCPEFTATLNAITAGLGYTYQWYNNNFAISGATVSTLNINNTGNYRVQISSGGCSNSSSPQYIHLSTPTLDTTGYVYTCAGNGYTINVSSSSLGSSYQWRKTDAPAGPVGTNSPAFTTTQPGNYVCDITYAGGCTKRSSSMVKLRNVPWACVMSKQGNEDEATPELSTTANMLELFPVPASEQLHVEVDISRLPVYELQITDLSGRVMHAGSHANEPTAVITVSQWPAGVYLLQLTNGDALHTRKLVVQH